ncbi:MAG: aspartate/glutamate racemase family protein [Rhodospirillaceae bacterium]
MTYRIGVIGTGGGPANSSAPPAGIAEIAGDRFAPELIETRLRTFPMTPYDRSLTTLAYIDCAIEAEKNGFDAVFINTVGDYGLGEIRSATDMVVVGAGEATMAMTCQTGARFSIVTIWPPKLNFIYQERLRTCGMEGRCSSVRNVLSDNEVEGVEGAGSTVLGLADHNAQLIDRVLQEIENAVLEDGADTIMLGCTCMAPIGPQIAAQSAVPVLESMRTGYAAVESLLTLGLRHSQITYPKARKENLSAVDKLISGQGNLDLGGDCEVCIVSDMAAE